MAQITKALLGIQFADAPLALASAPWKSSVAAIYGFNAAGTGYTTFRPASLFNSLTQLEQSGTYIVAAASATPNFTLPGAVLQHQPPPSSSGVSYEVTQVEVIEARIHQAGQKAQVDWLANEDGDFGRGDDQPVLVLTDTNLATGPHDTGGVCLVFGDAGRANGGASFDLYNVNVATAAGYQLHLLFIRADGTGTSPPQPLTFTVEP